MCKIMKMRSYTGRMFNPTNVTVKDIDILDIARSLSLQCRFNGHIKQFYSVAQHSVFVYELAKLYHNNLDFLKCCFMHDVTEAYLLDIPTPLKQHLPEYEIWENNLWSQMAIKFILRDPMPLSVKLYDKIALFIEMENLFVDFDNSQILQNLNNQNISITAEMRSLFTGALSPESAENLFLSTYIKLFNE